ncbi:MAG: transposase, partial [Planctomycetes bacterium]|nr:transposase [Planctomycetota bacterium]
MINRGKPIETSPGVTSRSVSRFENSVSRTDVLRIAFAMADVVLAAHERRRRANPVKFITIDLDGTIDRTYGSQQLTFFHGFYDSYGYL